MNRMICRHLDDFIRDPTDEGKRTAQLAESIQEQESTTVTLLNDSSEKSSERSPDKSYGHKDCQYPGLIIEVAYAQRKLKLVDKAEKYIRQTKGEIRTVIGVKIEYGKTAGGRASFLVWHANKGGVLEVGSPHTTMFRDENRQAIPSTDLVLSLKDFVCPKVAKRFNDVENTILISSAEICKVLGEAEKVQFGAGKSGATTGTRRSVRNQGAERPNYRV